MKPETSQQPFIFKPSAMPGGSGGRSATLESTAGRVHETQAEISEIVREVAQASATRLREAEYWSFLSDRVLRAMAAYGVVIWKQIRPGEFQVLSRLGETTDRALPDEAKPAHARLLREIADHHQPAVVPPTPGATDPDVPANPSSVPVALVAFGVSSADEDEPADYLIEVFLEPGGGVATQRGYLRFVAQMADLAGEFVRSQLLIRYRRDEIRTRQVDEASARFQQLQSPLSVAEAIVDEAAEAFSLDRVALVEADKTATVVAVSHVERIDSESPAVHWIEKLVGEHNEESPREAFWADVSIPRGMTDDAASQDRALEESPRHNGARSSGASGLAKTGESRLRCECIVPLFDDRSADGQTVQGTFLVGLVDESSSGPPFEDRIHFGRFAMFGGQALVHAQQRALPGTRWWSSLSGTTLAESRGRGKIRRLMAMFVLIALIATFVPVPLMVTSDATFHCEDIQAVCSPRNAVVEAVHVEHDQFVRAGDPLVTLRDDDLQQELTRLEGERLRLETEQNTQSASGRSADRIEDRNEVLNHVQIVKLRLEGVRSQIQHLREVEKSLHITAKHDGFVDAWRLRGRLDDRPVRFGESLLSVSKVGAEWFAEAEVEQGRLPDLRRIRAEEERESKHDSIRISPLAAPESSFFASISQLGPAILRTQEDPATLVRLNLMNRASGSPESLDREEAIGSLREGMPAKVQFWCGSAPLGYVLFRDAYSSVREFVGLHHGMIDGARLLGIHRIGMRR